MKIRLQNIASTLFWSASIGVIFLFVANYWLTDALPQAIYTIVGLIYCAAYLVALFYIFVAGRVASFKFGWVVLLFFFGMVLFPVFWSRHGKLSGSAT